MDYIELQGVRVPALDFGTMRLTGDDGVAAISKAVSEQHARENFDVFDFVLSADETAQIDALADNRRIVSPALAPSWDAA